MSDRYLELLKRTLTHSLWDDPGVPIDWFDRGRSWPKRLALRGLSATLAAVGLEAVRRPYIWPRHAESMLPLARLDHVEDCLRLIASEGIPGDVIECGVWRGGCCIFMRACLDVLEETGRVVWVADSFRGLPPPDESSNPTQDQSLLHLDPLLSVSADQVRANFEKYGPFQGRVEYLEGWFHETLTRAPLETLALIRLDGDLYSSTMDAFEALYPKLSPGGVAIVDDYHLPGCRKATNQFLERCGLDPSDTLIVVDEHAVWFRKPGAVL